VYWVRVHQGQQRSLGWVCSIGQFLGRWARRGSEDKLVEYLLGGSGSVWLVH
jgi:hypothetical protein